MSARRGSSPLWSVLLLALCLWLGWSVYQSVTLPADPPPEDPGAAEPEAIAVVALPEAPRFEMPPLEQFSEVVDRPLFSPNRRPPAPGAAPTEPTRSTLEATVVGIILSNQERIAIIDPGGGAKLMRLGQGDALQGWTLVAIEADRLTFRRDDIDETLELVHDRPPPPLRGRRNQRRATDDDQEEP